MPRILLAVLLAMGMSTTAALAGQVYAGSNPSAAGAPEAGQPRHLKPAPESPALQAPQTGQLRHTVVTGDTLWDIAGKYYRNPWEWPRIWEANKSIVKDPDLIEPNQVLAVPEAAAAPEQPAVLARVEPAAETKEAPITAVVPALEKEEIAEAAEEAAEENAAGTSVVVPDPEPAAEPAPALEQNNVTGDSPAVKKYFEAEGMAVPKDWKSDGVIVGEKDKKLLISQGDTVYLNLGADRVRPGTQLMVYRRFDKLRDPRTGDFLGYEVRRVGRLEVTKCIEQDASTAKVTMSYEPIETGDAVTILGE